MLGGKRRGGGIHGLLSGAVAAGTQAVSSIAVCVVCACAHDIYPQARKLYEQRVEEHDTTMAEGRSVELHAPLCKAAEEALLERKARTHSGVGSVL